ncbi:hypothetical protein BS17DRAFT_125369 [Gyrodon lividus]|nr:hypothetical protein BS17DRAFT_125369 [Gyrodon lividus]
MRPSTSSQASRTISGPGKAFNTNTYSYASSGTTPQPLLHPAIMAYATISERHATLPTALLVDLYHSLGCMVLPSTRLQYVRMDWNTTPSPTRSVPCPGHHRHRAQISSGFPRFSTASVLPNPHTPSFRHHATFSHAQYTTSSRRYFIVTSKNKATRLRNDLGSCYFLVQEEQPLTRFLK